MPDVDQSAMALADLAAMDTKGTMASKVEAAVWAYLWALENTKPVGNSSLWTYPSYNELRDALAGRGQSKGKTTYTMNVLAQPAAEERDLFG